MLVPNPDVKEFKNEFNEDIIEISHYTKENLVKIVINIDYDTFRYFQDSKFSKNEHYEHEDGPDTLRIYFQEVEK
jgi:hypothetical protein